MRIREIMKAKDISSSELAHSLDISVSALNQNITGNPSKKILDKIASALEVPTWQLFVDPEDIYNKVSQSEPDFIALIKSGKDTYSASSLDEAMGILEKLKK